MKAAQIGAGIVSTAIGIAVEVSHVQGVLAGSLAWGAVGFGVILIVIGLARSAGAGPEARDDDPEPPTLNAELADCAARILAFMRERDLVAPLPPRPESRLRHPIRATRASQEVREHNADTLSLYRQQFSPEVRALVRDLVSDARIGEHEARALRNPRDSGGIERVGVRFSELADRASRRPRSAA